MATIRKSHFTLLELLIVILIISMGAALTGIKIRDIYHEQRFLSDVNQVSSHLAMAQDLMLILDADVLVRIAPDRDSKVHQIWLEVDKPLRKSWEKIIKRKIPLKAIEAIHFDESQRENITLLFSLGSMSKGTLKLYEDAKHKEKNRKHFIQLVGYPRPIKGTADEEKRTNFTRPKAEKSKLLYPEEVYQKLYEDKSAS